MQPGGDGGLSSELIGAAKRRDQRVLQSIGSLFRVTSRAQGYRPETITMALHQRGEGLRITSDVGSQEISIRDLRVELLVSGTADNACHVNAG